MHHTVFVLLAVSFARAKSGQKTLECASRDEVFSNLIGWGQSGKYVTCTYLDAGLCAYSADGLFSTGDTSCPSKLAPKIRVTCPDVDENGSKLLGSGRSGGFKTCTYPGAGLCTYFLDGWFSSGGATCPDSIISSTSNGDDDTGSDKSGDGGISGGSFISSSGATCPDSNISSTSNGDNDAGSDKSDDGGISGSFLADADDNLSDGSNQKPGPAVTALIAVNVVLVMIIFVSGGLWYRSYRSAAKSAHRRMLYTGIEPEYVSPHSPRYNTEKDSAAVPLTQGLSSSRYHDPHE